ncbi:hypothetical protein JL722_8841 [Aureococcus anophagefferens]|nr:hypothetical protein JL722_8841 [Aureococcus anophagefferens]
MRREAAFARAAGVAGVCPRAADRRRRARRSCENVCPRAAGAPRQCAHFRVRGRPAAARLDGNARPGDERPFGFVCKNGRRRWCAPAHERRCFACGARTRSPPSTGPRARRAGFLGFRDALGARCRRSDAGALPHVADLALAGVSERGLRLAARLCPNLKRLDVSGCAGGGDAAVLAALLERCPKLETLVVGAVGAAGLRTLAALGLRSLSVGDFGYGDLGPLAAALDGAPPTLLARTLARLDVSDCASMFCVDFVAGLAALEVFEARGLGIARCRAASASWRGSGASTCRAARRSRSCRRAWATARARAVDVAGCPAAKFPASLGGAATLGQAACSVNPHQLADTLACVELLLEAGAALEPRTTTEHTNPRPVGDPSAEARRGRVREDPSLPRDWRVSPSGLTALDFAYLSGDGDLVRALEDAAGLRYSARTHRRFPRPARYAAAGWLRLGYRVGSGALLPVWASRVLPFLVARTSRAPAPRLAAAAVRAPSEAFAVGATVRVVGLAKATQHNGKLGRVCRKAGPEGRVGVALDLGGAVAIRAARQATGPAELATEEILAASPWLGDGAEAFFRAHPFAAAVRPQRQLGYWKGVASGLFPPGEGEGVVGGEIAERVPETRPVEVGDVRARRSPPSSWSSPATALSASSRSGRTGPFPSTARAPPRRRRAAASSTAPRRCASTLRDRPAPRRTSTWRSRTGHGPGACGPELRRAGCHRAELSIVAEALPGSGIAAGDLMVHVAEFGKMQSDDGLRYHREQRGLTLLFLKRAAAAPPRRAAAPIASRAPCDTRLVEDLAAGDAAPGGPARLLDAGAATGVLTHLRHVVDGAWRSLLAIFFSAAAPFSEAGGTPEQVANTRDLRRKIPVAALGWYLYPSERWEEACTHFAGALYAAPAAPGDAAPPCEPPADWSDLWERSGGDACAGVRGRGNAAPEPVVRGPRLLKELFLSYATESTRHADWLGPAAGPSRRRGARNQDAADAARAR